VIDPNQYSRSSLIYNKKPLYKNIWLYGLGEERRKTKQKNIDKKLYA